MDDADVALTRVQIEAIPPFRCPCCREPLAVRWTAGLPHCATCDWLAGGADGTLDFVADSAREAERRYYDEEYRAAGSPAATPPSARAPKVEALAPLWRETPIGKARVSILGDVRDKRVLVLGNGDSDAELYFLALGARQLVVSDLSPEGLRAVRGRYEIGPRSDRVAFAAIDALDLPLLDESVDVVYGDALVHHLPDVERFLAEVVRVLRPGGRAVFIDNAYAPMWHWLKQTLLRPLMLYTHRRQPISPEDLHFTMSGGFRIDELERLVRAAGAAPWFVRENLLYYLWARAAVRLFPRHWSHLGTHPGATRALVTADRWLSRRSAFVRRNLIDLYWGLEKLQT